MSVSLLYIVAVDIEFSTVSVQLKSKRQFRDMKARHNVNIRTHSLKITWDEIMMTGYLKKSVLKVSRNAEKGKKSEEVPPALELEPLLEPRWRRPWYNSYWVYVFVEFNLFSGENSYETEEFNYSKLFHMTQPHRCFKKNQLRYYVWSKTKNRGPEKPT